MKSPVTTLLLALAIVSSLGVACGTNVASQPEKKEQQIVVKVFGKVAKPGAFQLAKGSTLLDALAAAGGWTPTADLTRVALLRGPADETPRMRQYDVRLILKAKAANPRVEDGDAIHVEERIL